MISHSHRRECRRPSRKHHRAGCHPVGTTTRSRRTPGTDRWAVSFDVLLKRSADGGQVCEVSRVEEIPVRWPSGTVRLLPFSLRNIRNTRNCYSNLCCACCACCGTKGRRAEVAHPRVGEISP